MHLIDQYKVDLKRLNSVEIYQKYILDSDCFALNKEQHMDLKNQISAKYGVKYTDIFVVGSAKLGFSIKPKRRYGPFGDESDIDVAIVSTALFSDIWEQAYNYKQSNALWEKQGDFFKYLSQGWIRPDKFPNNSEIFPLSNEWWEFFRYLTNSRKFGPYKISAGIYFSHFFLSNYQSVCINQCKEQL